MVYGDSSTSQESSEDPTNVTLSPSIDDFRLATTGTLLPLSRRRALRNTNGLPSYFFWLKTQPPPTEVRGQGPSWADSAYPQPWFFLFISQRLPRVAFQDATIPRVATGNHATIPRVAFQHATLPKVATTPHFQGCPSIRNATSKGAGTLLTSKGTTPATYKGAGQYNNHRKLSTTANQQPGRQQQLPTTTQSNRTRPKTTKSKTFIIIHS
jgi:hypothetical protein